LLKVCRRSIILQTHEGFCFMYSAFDVLLW
jgi:hypothetical protein